MKLDSIITLASGKVRLPFLMLERSLRAVGCQLPMHVIPYNDDTFPLPKGSEWWEVPEFLKYIDDHGKRPVMRKYQVLLAENFQFLDTDAIFLRNPEEVLENHTGWINSCGHWHNPQEATTEGLGNRLHRHTTTWQKSVFNSGQFACDQALYTTASFQEAMGDEEVRQIVLEDSFHEQPGMNLLVHLSGVAVSNLTLTASPMESTWAGDYPDNDYSQTWQDPSRKPYLLHWAGRKMNGKTAIDQLALSYLTENERRQWRQQLSENPVPDTFTRLRHGIRAAKHAFGDSLKG